VEVRYLVAPVPSDRSDFFDRAGDAVRVLVGAERLHLTAIEELPAEADEEGAHDFMNGIVYLHPITVMLWIDRILAGKVSGPKDGHSALNALVTTLHELVHNVGPADRGAYAGRSTYFLYDLKGPVDYEEAISELAARMLLTPFMQTLEIQGGLPSSGTFESAIYLGKMAAVAPVIEKFAEEADLEIIDAVKILAAQVPDTRGRAVATVLASRLRLEEPGKRTRFISEVERAFMDLQQVPDITADGYSGWARQQLEAAIRREG
jgi:hypothetical protein